VAGRDHRFYGRKACEALCAVRPDAVQRAFFDEATAGAFGELMRSLAARRRPYRVVDLEELEKVSGTRHHEGVCLVADALEPPRAPELLEALDDGPARWIFLDGVSNPHNVGAILRVAAHFGRSALAALPDELPAISGAVARIAEGGAEHVHALSWPDPSRALDRLSGHGFVTVATVVSGGAPLYEVALPPRVVFLLGAEREGVSEAALAAADLTVTIPGTGDVESLNVATAAAVLLGEHSRRHPGS